jgi:hypothetical protein
MSRPEGWIGFLTAARQRPNRVEAFPSRPLLAMIERFRGRTVCLVDVHPTDRVRDGAGKEYAFAARGDELVAVKLPPALKKHTAELATGSCWEVVGKITGTVAVFRRIGAQVRHHHALLVEAEGVAAPGKGAVIFGDREPKHLPA